MRKFCTGFFRSFSHENSTQNVEIRSRFAPKAHSIRYFPSPQSRNFKSHAHEVCARPMRDPGRIILHSSLSSVRSTGGSALGCSSTQDLSMPYWSCVQLKKLATKDRPVDSKDNPDPDPWRLPPRPAATTLLRTRTSHAAPSHWITSFALLAPSNAASVLWRPDS